LFREKIYKRNKVIFARTIIIIAIPVVAFL